MSLDATGNLVTINGDLTVSGNITTRTLTADQIYSPAIATLAAQLNQLSLIQTATSSSTATPSANLLSVTVETASVAATPNGPILTTTASAGTTQIPEGYSHITINNPKITQNTLIYVTPISSTNNRTLYVKLQSDGQAIIGFDTPNTAPVSFNWWLVEPNTTPTAANN